MSEKFCGLMLFGKKLGRNKYKLKNDKNKRYFLWCMYQFVEAL